MKHHYFLSVVFCAFLINLDVFGFSQPLDPATSNYVVVGAFASLNNASQFVARVKKLNFNAISEMNPSRNLYYVYVLNTGDRNKAVTEANKIRKETSFADTWVFSGMLGVASSGGTDLNPAKNEKIVHVQAEDEKTLPLETAAAPKDSIVVKAEPVSEQTSSVVETPTTRAIVPDAEPGSKNFVFEIFTALEKKTLPGDIDIIDVDRSRKVATFKGNENVVVRPLNKSGKLSLVCEVFGYRTIKRNLDFNKPEDTEFVALKGNQHVVQFEVTRLKKGDFSIMYNVYFFQDAGIMRPDSRPEVTSLLEMMKENTKYKIRIHGHTNGNAAGKIISMGEGRKFFSLDDTKQGYGSAKKLSEERANVIREFLISGGVAPDRMEVKAWGGKRPIHDKDSANARENVRVEIEVLED